MKNKIAIIFRNFAIVTFITYFLFAVIYGLIIENNFMSFIYICSAGFLESILLYAIAEIIEQLDYANSINRGIYIMLEKIEKTISKIPNEHSTANTFVTEETKNDDPESFTWICPQCGNMNLSSVSICKKCKYTK